MENWLDLTEINQLRKAKQIRLDHNEKNIFFYQNGKLIDVLVNVYLPNTSGLLTNNVDKY